MEYMTKMLSRAESKYRQLQGLWILFIVCVNDATSFSIICITSTDKGGD
jgi:hypothetical protein